MACMRDGFEQGKLLDNRFITQAPLNHGSFGMVFTAKDKLSGNDVAIKCITKPGAQVNCPTALAIDDQSEELAIHARLPAHDHIVNLIHTFQTQHHQYMVLELCGNGDLYEAIRLGKGPLETEHVRDFMLQLVDAVQHIHDNGVYHRDIKPENIFLTASGTMKIGDFGLATTDTWSTEFAVGSDRYMAPEQFDASVYGYGYSPASADVWAIGIVLLNILFQRNPFATPTQQDPLFADFANDRQSLFDVFPTMSQDTYNVIRHSLALDPANRSLAAVREALKSVVTFTTDDESLDEFCTEQSEIVPMATAAREPLRTPSITSPTGQQEYPWTSMTSPHKTLRHLPTIPDEDTELFPASSFPYEDTDEASLSSNVDSGLGMSYKSSKSNKSFIPKQKVSFVGSLPISFTRPNKITSPYGASGFSKSWSDLWDEDMAEDDSEMDDSLTFDIGNDISRVSTAKPSTPQMSRGFDNGRGSVTPRQAKVEPDRTYLSSGATTPMPDGKPALPKTKSSSILDKWAALGNFRRAKQDAPPPVAVQPVAAQPVTATPTKSRYTDALSSFAFGSNKKQTPSAPVNVREHGAVKVSKVSPTRARAHSANGRWDRREHSPKHPVVPALPEQWLLDNNWREHKPPAAAAPVLRQQRVPSNAVFKDDIGDLEWVGGWKDFHI